MKIVMSRIWNSYEIKAYNLYIKSGKTSHTIRTLFPKLSEIIGEKLLLISGIGLASLVLFQRKASSILYLLAMDRR